MYITDGGFFNHNQYSEIADGYTKKEIQEVILVGIGYPDNYTINDVRNFRSRDLTIQPGMTLNFIREEVIPYIDSNYHTEKGNNTIIGNSAGGFFVSFILMNYREDNDFPFRNLFAVAQLYSFETEEAAMASEINDLPVNFYLAIGSLDNAERIDAYNTLVNNLGSRNYLSFSFEHKIYEGLRHGEVSSTPAFRDAFRTFLKYVEPQVLTNESELTEIYGYPNPSNGKIYLTIPDNSALNSLKLLNISGLETNFLYQLQNNILEMDLTSLSQGLYILYIETTKGVISNKIIKTK